MTDLQTPRLRTADPAPSDSTDSSCAADACGSAPVRRTGSSALRTRVDIALQGIRVDAPVHREAGAGPSDDGHVMLGGLGAAIPVNPKSPYAVTNGRLLLDGADIGLDVEPVKRPRFYDLSTADGVSYEKIARLHGRNILATTVVQTCMRYDEAERCRFCAIEASLANDSTIAVKTPAQLAEVAEAAARLDGIRQMVMTTGTSKGRDRGARHLARCVRAVLQAVPGLPIQVQCEPPEDLAALQELKDAGALSIGIHIESMDDDIRRRWTPGKARVSTAKYWEAWDEAVRIFGRNQVSTYLLVGLGEDPDELVASAGELIERGIYPFVVPFRPLKGTLATEVDHVLPPAGSLLEKVSEQVAALLIAAGMLSSGQKAGCAACGACGVLKTAGA
ncbi:MULTISPECIES: MSMEG_0568 family radical SAM protein [unclassified Rathayibacter]|uniref:MSMEG_0568 family radical SAM protein n=1 Tax=unclassified Rathayibacter TaxID=2609250 RepID=UPI0010518938|nr:MULTISPECIES: MSMEG_0568 family radical SAM protein [unclassified Rathayibacter]TCL78882.1 radical SAM protein (TIGR04043 family) [Rathayibacter sp. PhB192]TCM24952.1 radical SAM protein (TIGR04043 family) [Rathayibacter sp. PhB179]